MENLAEEVHKTFMACLYQEDELKDGAPKDAIVAEGITEKFGFHPGRTEQNRERIRTFLDRMPDEFHKSGGGGTTFLNLCMDRDGIHWAEHPTMQELVCLGIAVGMVSYPLPREAWKALPGGVPYVTINTTREPKEVG